MQFGLTNPVAKFQRLMDFILEGRIPAKNIAYTKVVLINGRTIDEHLLTSSVGRCKTNAVKVSEL